MAMPINDLLVSGGANIFYDQAFRNTLETNMGLLRASTGVITIAIESHDAYKYENDLYGLLQKLLYPEDAHWVIMRLNDFVDPREFSSTTTTLLIPDFTAVEQIRRLYMTRTTKV